MANLQFLLKEALPGTVAALRAKLVDPSTPLPERYRVMFSLRNVAGPEAQAALVEGGCLQTSHEAQLLTPLLSPRRRSTEGQ